MDIFDHDDEAKVTEISDDQEFRAFVHGGGKGILCRTQVLDDSDGLMPETYRFAKWMRSKRADVHIDVTASEGTHVLKSSEYWMPLVFLASNVSLPMFIGLITSYVYDMAKGRLQHQPQTIHTQVFYQDEATKKTKKFTYSGSVEGLEKTFEHFDINAFMEDKH